MLAELEKGPTKATGASEDQLALRKKMTEDLIIEESKHEALEEMYFWPAVREHLQAGDTLADEATGQEQEAKQVLAELDKLEAGDAEFEELLGKFTVDGPRAHRVRGDAGVAGLRSALPADDRGRAGRPRSPKARRPRPRGRIRTRRLRRACSRRRGRRGGGGQGARRGDRTRQRLTDGRRWRIRTAAARRLRLPSWQDWQRWAEEADCSSSSSASSPFSARSPRSTRSGCSSPYNPAISSNTSQPDWYIGFLEGALRLMPPWETDFAGHTIRFPTHEQG